MSEAVEYRLMRVGGENGGMMSFRECAQAMADACDARAAWMAEKQEDDFFCLFWIQCAKRGGPFYNVGEPLSRETLFLVAGEKKGVTE